MRRPLDGSVDLRRITEGQLLQSALLCQTSREERQINTVINIVGTVNAVWEKMARGGERGPRGITAEINYPKNRSDDKHRRNPFALTQFRAVIDAPRAHRLLAAAFREP